ncbi:heterokaryon incompatibility protein-domain-containing protein [Cercophora newfieldiana]|uniref:Heterokaryon incompatibility protein-domain-containing protein n=1 Tax=Cercophora newfieldiana TaxID=92897 RepID=A0AA39Y8R5_9PEZI|nr:heterokaryon incompatibility protein-domain-containing protein [Cercophora newfieldiana]
MAIQPNLHAALRMLLSLDALSRTEFVWADAICINQSDLDERASQVRLMGRLYSQAKSVIAWLGPSDATVPDALSVLDRLAFLGKNAYPFGVSLLDTRAATVASSSVAHIAMGDWADLTKHESKLGIDIIFTRQWLCFVAFLARPYFSRLWQAYFFMQYTNWEEYLFPHVLQRSAQIVNHSLGFEKVLTTPVNSTNTVINLAKIMSWSGMEVEHESTRVLYETICFVELLDEVRRCKATDPRDKIYGVLGILALTKTPFSDMGGRAEDWLIAYVKVNYQDPVETVYARTIRAIITESRSLRVRPWHGRDNTKAFSDMNANSCLLEALSGKFPSINTGPLVPGNPQRSFRPSPHRVQVLVLNTRFAAM